ncbi:hypothetical protein Y032_0038g3659 [Ancylostoma ceylanicum]|uniref:PLAT domain-containing protein n=1 Tax=Ancylostoma ceylanicum TaxID=53326 RepID=A0A016UKX5_9BILA|nr:hypothetical protein Y032_0038g3659 [Ancylostoma ceylanicum]
MTATAPSTSEDGTVTASNTTYSIAVRTSAVENAETAAFVFVQLIDEAGNKTDRMKLKCSLTHRKKYQRGHSDLFLLVDQPYLGRLKQIEVMHVVKDTADEAHHAWHCHSIMVLEHENFLLYRFPCGQWIGNADSVGISNLE